ncbi:MAG: GTPase [Pseudomonadota bacterium]
MQLKSFTAPSVAEAMELVRESFGDDAIIISTRRDGEGGGVRITAAIDDGTPLRDDDERVDQASALDAADAIAQALDFHGAPAALTDRLIGIASNLMVDDPASALAVALDAAFVFEPIPVADLEKPLLFCGPPGAGKTVTCAKFATRAALADLPVRIVAADSVRAGGFEQIAAFARVLQADCVPAGDAATAREAVRDAHLGDVVLIDAPASNPYRAAEMTALAELGRETGAEAILVLPAGLHAREASDAAKAFRDAGCQRLVGVRLDAAKRLGALIGAAYDARLKLSDFCASDQAAQGLTPATPLALARMLLPDLRS